jgi:hypothetical protein
MPALPFYGFPGTRKAASEHGGSEQFRHDHDEEEVKEIQEGHNCLRGPIRFHERSVIRNNDQEVEQEKIGCNGCTGE